MAQVRFAPDSIPSLPTFWPGGIAIALRWTGDPRTDEMKARWAEMEAELERRKALIKSK